MGHVPKRCIAVFVSVTFLIAATGVISAAAPTQKDVAAGDYDSYLYGAASDEVMLYTSTATGDVNGDGLEDLIMGHDQGGTGFPYLYTGKVYVYYGRTDLGHDVDLGSGADVTINGYYAGFAGASVACGNINADSFDDIIIGCYLDSPAGATYSGGVAVIFGSATLPAAWDFNADDPDLYISAANGGEMAGMSVASGDIDGDFYDDVLFGAHLGNGGVHFGDGSGWQGEGGANPDSLRDVSMYGTSGGWAVGEYISAYSTLYFYDGTSWDDTDTGFHDQDVDFNGVAAHDASHVWAVGEGGTVISWNGTTWSQQNSTVAVDLRDVSAADASNAWAVGDSGTIIHTGNGGASWAAQSSGTGVALRGASMYGTSPNFRGWAVGDSGIIRHYDGASWAGQSSPVSTTLRAVCRAPGTDTAWAVGDSGTIIHYDGANWSQQTSNTAYDLRGVSATGASTAWAVGDSGTILKTLDGGTTWNKQATLFSQQQNAACALDSTHIWTVGEAATGRAYISWGRANGDWPAWDYTDPLAPDRVVNGVASLDAAGYPVTTGDLNGDTCDDIFLGAFEADGPGDARPGCGEGYVVYGRNKGVFPNFVNLDTASNCTIYGASQMDGIPSSVCVPLKEVNGDRFDDLIMGIVSGDGPGDTRPGCGELDVIYGGSLPAFIDLATDAPDMMIYGPREGSAVGYSVEALDFNGDTLTDLAAASPGAGAADGGANAGAAWLVNGTDPQPSQVDLATSASMVFYGADEGDGFGFCLSSANLNGDPVGYQDLVISDPNGEGPGNTRPRCGEHYVFLGYDNVHPTCSIVNVAEGSVLCGTVGVQVNASDYYGIDRVEFLLDGSLMYTDTSAPYSWDWDTRQQVDGSTPVLEAKAYDTAGNSASDSRRVTLNNTIPPLSDTWYLAEGTTAWDFETWVLVQNPNPEAADIAVTFMRPGGATQTEIFPLEGNSRFTIPVNSYVEESDVSTKVEASAPVICERAMYWDDRVEGHDSIGVINPSPTWYLAEGTTAWDFETWVLVQNPNTQSVDVTMTFMRPGGFTQTHTFPVDGQARYTVNVNDLVETSDVSTKVEASSPVICERAMYRYGKELGTDTIGTPSTSLEWYMAEGTTAWGFDEYVLIQNPNEQQTSVGLEFMLPDGSVVPYGVVIPGLSRHTVYVNAVPGCEETDLSTYVLAERPVICERAMYWQGAETPGAHATIGTPLPSTHWYLAEGTTAWGFEEYVLVQNPNDTQAVVSFIFMKPDGSTEFLSVPVEANSRFTIKANDVVPDTDISTAVVSDLPVICERAMYFDARNVGTGTIGVRGGS